MAIGAKRSPLHDPRHVADLASEIVARPELELDGLMAYEAQIAGVGDGPPGKPLLRLALPVVQALSARELARRRAEIVDAVRSIAPLRFVNGGGTGSIERTAAEPAVTEVAAGQRAVRPDAVRHLPRVHAAARGAVRAAGGAQAVVRSSRRCSAAATRPQAPAGRDRLPRPFLPAGLKLDAREGAGEVQTPLAGKAAAGLRVGDRVWFRHAKAGELCERFDVVHLDPRRARSSTPCRRTAGEGKTFL